MVKERIVLIALIVLCTVLGTAGVRTTFPSFDFMIPGDEAARFLATGTFPEKSCVSSLGSYIPPGTSWLEIPSMALHRPLFLQLPSAAMLFALTLVGIYLLAKECAGPWTGYAAVALFGLSANGTWWALSFWPRAYPVCYVWMAFFTVLWVKQRKARYLFGATLVFLLGLSAHMELIYAALPVALVWLWQRPPIGKWALPAAIACSLIVWLPYFRFEAGRQFIDLRSQLLRHHLPEYDTHRAFPGMIERFDTPSQAWVPLDEAAGSRPYPPRSFLRVIEDIIPSSFVNFRNSRPIATMVLAIGLTFLAASGFVLRSSWSTWAQDRALPITIVCLSLALPWLLLSASEPPGVGYRQWGLWSLECVVACTGVSFLLALPRGRWIAVVLILLWGMSDGKNTSHVIASIAKDGWAGRECNEARICDAISEDSHGGLVRVGYFVVFHGFEMALAPQDPTQKVGIQFDRYLRWGYGIENQAMNIKGFGDDDVYRVLQTSPDNWASLRFIPDLTGFTKILTAGSFELWKREAS